MLLVLLASNAAFWVQTTAWEEPGAHGDVEGRTIDASTPCDTLVGVLPFDVMTLETDSDTPKGLELLKRPNSADQAVL